MNKKLIILGAGESGVGAALLGKRNGYDVLVSDKGNIAENYKKELQEAGINYEEGKHSMEKLLQANMLVKSPGIPNHVAVITQLKAQGVTPISEIEWASRFVDAPIIAITGSNGKTTTTMLTHHLLQKSGFDAALVGNIGTGFSRIAASGKSYDCYVVEVSSFQLDDIQDFCPFISAITNLTPDHLDRYGNSFKQYVMAKFRITENQTKRQHLISNADDKISRAFIKRLKPQARLHQVSTKNKVENGAYANERQIILTNGNIEQHIERNALKLPGSHNLSNALMASLMAQLMGADATSIAAAMTSFKAIAHRLEPVAEIDGVQYINDSKATNVDSVWYALQSMERPTVWIVGGKDKGNDYAPLLPFVKQKVKAIVCLGADNSKVLNFFNDKVPNIIETQSAEQAVRKARSLARWGDAVLLSPACASFDLFDNYIHRGELFKLAVEKIAKETEKQTIKND